MGLDRVKHRGNVQIVWKKFLRYFDVVPRIVPLKPGNYRLTAEQLDKYVDENTICVVAIAGQTFTGEDDDIQEIHDLSSSSGGFQI
jgi:glutamate decarboxylase